ncbi:hypothetical protein [Companilactobacillus nodensis]|uniref:WxL domain-containing protein n=1 Tax=Companilactobacillus nodensis DSM 19682 = JCM 14932 = NBRC 107160 TaxID=1423775 RepID=A0A0R1KFZ5_9LACO|nr:hypothetical protein [Companilactobacillus nodensis]KRK79377.1 hypothetical protein FD03_GL001744 [Companilactobacillus nodensis DSM 19682 = JCM 14932 = NBRC 107160]
MKFNNLFLSRILIIALLLSSFVQPITTEAATFGSPIAIDKRTNEQTTSSLTPNADSKKTLAITEQANQQLTADVVTQFSTPLSITPDANQTTLLNSLVSPLTLYNKVTTGDVNANGYYIEADVGYLFSTIRNDVNVANTTTISLKSINNNAPGTVNTWTIKRGVDSPVSSTKIGKTATITGFGDSITMSSDKTATLVGSTTDVRGVNVGLPSGGYMQITAQITNNMPASLMLSLGGVVDSYDYIQHADVNTLMHFSINPDTFDEVYNSMKSYSRTDLKNFQITGLSLHWKRDYRLKGNAETNPTAISDDVTDVLNGYDSSELSSEYLFYKQPDQNSPIEYPYMNGVYAELILDYTYKSGILFPTTKTGQLVTNFGGDVVEPSVTPTTPEQLPEVKLDNEIHNLTNSESDSPDSDGKYLAVKNVKKDDAIQYTANFNLTYDNTGENTGTISKSTYTVPISKGMDIDTDSFKFTDDDGNVSVINPNNVSVAEDSDDSTKQLLTVNNVNLDPKGIDDTNFKLVFNGTVTNDNQSDFTFTPTFKGIGGYENSNPSKPLYIDASGREQLINFNNTVEPGGGISLAPVNIDFGSLNSFVTTDVLRHRVKNDDAPVLSVQDDRSDSDKKSQTISVEQMDDLTNGSVQFPGQLRFYDPNNNSFTPLTIGGPVPIYISKDGETMSSISWADDKGLLLHINGANTAIPSGKYTTSLDWTVRDTI